MSAEDRLLLLLARGSFLPEFRQRAGALVDPGLDWTRFLDLSEAHGVLPLVARNLASLGEADIPGEVRRALGTARRINAARNLLAARLLRELLACLGEAGVPVIPLKGVALGESLYGDAAVRVSSDVDILVPRENMVQAFRLLVRLGYSRAEAEPEVDPSDLDLLRESNIEYAFVPPQSPGCPVELHWNIAWRWPRDLSAVADLWAGARPGRFEGVEVHRLSPEWEVLYLAVHAARHRWHALKWLVDVHEICVRGGVDWHETRSKAARLGLGEVLAITLGACRSLLDTPVPPGGAAEALPRWLSLFPSVPVSQGIWREAVYPARLFARPSEKLRYLVRVLFLPTLSERRLIRLPAGMEALYYPLRPLRLGGKWVRDLLRSGVGRHLRGPSGVDVGGGKSRQSA